MWTIESELRRLSGSETIGEAVVLLGLAEAGEDVAIELAGPWRRGGAETYICEFSVTQGRKSPREFILKACVAFSPGRTLHEILEEWVRRRTILSNHGISTPHLAYAGEGVVLEERVPYALASVLSLSDVDVRRKLLHQLGKLTGVLAAQRFAVVNPFSDLRSHGSTVCVIDFGADLGPPHQEFSAIDHLSKLWRTLEEWSILLERQEIALIEDSHQDMVRKLAADTQSDGTRHLPLWYPT